MRILVQNKLLPAVVPPYCTWPTSAQSSSWAGPRQPPRPRTDSPPGHGYVQLYLGKGPDTHSAAQRGPGSPTCWASPPKPGAAPAPVRRRCHLRVSPATALVCRFSLFHSKGSCGHVQLTGPKEFKNKTTRQRVKLMQVFSFCFFICFSFASVLEKRGVQGLAEKRRMYRASPAEAVAPARGRGGRSGQAGSSLRTRERCGRRFPSQESASFL